MDHPAAIIAAIVGGAFTLAIIATLVSKQANTGSVLTSAGQGLGSIITAAVSPLGTGSQIGTALPQVPTSNVN
jgi:hypothetical protein